MFRVDPNAQRNGLAFQVYHGSACPELRLSAKVGQFLPWRKVHSPHWSRNRETPATPFGWPHAGALTVDGRTTAMVATKAHLLPWSPLRCSMGLQ